MRGWDAGWHHVGLGGAMRDLTPYARCHYHAPGHTMGACQAYYGGKGILWQYFIINKYIVFNYHIPVPDLPAHTDRQVVIYLSKTHSQSERDWRASVPFAPSRAALSMLHSCQLPTPRFNSSPKVLHLIRPV